jgi:thiamine-phosphate pyrophosphorylase
MRLPRVYPIIDTESLKARELRPETAADAFLEGGAGIMQIRHKSHWTRAVLDSARVVCRLCREAGATFVVNDRADIAMLLEAGVHVGQDDLPPRDVRKLIGGEPPLGCSSHNMQQLVLAGGEPVDYVAFGPVFRTISKRNPDPTIGVDEIRRCRPLLDKPLVAIGGINLDNALSVREAGADSVAVIAALLPESPTPQSLRKRMEQWQQLLKAD